MKKTAIILLISVVLAQTGSKTLFGQENREISLTAMNESIAFPFTSYSEFHPGFELGITLLSKDKDHSIRQLNTYVGWFLHQHIENGFFFRGEYSYKIKLGKGLTAGVYGGAGYLHTFYPGTLYEIDEETGEFFSSKQLGRSRALISAGLQLSYRSEAGFEPFVKQEFAVETPFANGIPLMPHSFLKLGININI